VTKAWPETAVTLVVVGALLQFGWGGVFFEAGGAWCLVPAPPAPSPVTCNPAFELLGLIWLTAGALNVAFEFLLFGLPHRHGRIGQAVLAAAVEPVLAILPFSAAPGPGTVAIGSVSAATGAAGGVLAMKWQVPA
jgi:hypothetical protein